MSHLAILLGVCCGMRRGEIRGLKWEDIGANIIHVRHNFVDFEPIKEPKKGSKRDVPYTSSVRAGFERLKAVTNPKPTDFVFASVKCPGEPIGGTFFRKALRRELEAIDIACDWRKQTPPPENYSDEQKRRNLTFHGLRHTFVTLGRLAGISDLEIQALAGHKSAAMMSRYSHADQVLDYTKIQNQMESAYEVQTTGGNA
jgi:integrase